MNTQRIINLMRLLIITFSLFLLSLQLLYAEEIKNVEINLKYGAEVFRFRCTLCHGNQGHGDGVLPIAMKDYPHTNLYENRYGDEIAEIKKSVIYGGIFGAMSVEMPPWGDELTHIQLGSVTLFTRFLIKQPDKAVALLRQANTKSKPSVRRGRTLFRNSCTLCHGQNGEGDGRMARVIKNPPPFNLTVSRAPDAYLEKIIREGGEANGRSPRMPPWGDQLTKEQIKSVILYLMTLRK